MPTHARTHLDEHGQSANIDLGMVDLIRALWRHGITTTNCCEGDPTDDWPSAYVAIAAEDFPRFLDLVGDALALTREAASRRLNIHLGATPENSVCWSNHLPERIDGIAWHDGDRWRAALALRLPAADIPRLTAALEAV